MEDDWIKDRNGHWFNIRHITEFYAMESYLKGENWIIVGVIQTHDAPLEFKLEETYETEKEAQQHLSYLLRTSNFRG